MVYGAILLMPAIAYYLLQKAIMRNQGRNSVLANALGSDIKGKISPILYVMGIVLAFVSPRLSVAMYVLVAVCGSFPIGGLKEFSMSSDGAMGSRGRAQAHLIRDRCARLSQPPNVSSATPRAPAPPSPQPTAKRHRNKRVPMLAAGANSRALARLAAAQQPDRRSAAGTLPAPARGRKLQPG